MATTERIHFTPRPDDAWQRAAVGFVCDSDNGWTATGAVTRTRSRVLAITEVVFHGPTDDDGAPGPVTSLNLRQLPTGAILAGAMHRGLLANNAEVVPRKPVGRSGRAPLSDELIRSVAESYLAETAPGRPRGVIQRLAEQFGKPVPTIGRWVMRARADGWLGPAVSGREGGEPGPRLIAEQRQAE